jgi:long-chain acyl-CoA synthetase
MSATLQAEAPAPQITTTTIATRVRDWAARAPDAVAMREKDFGIWQEVTWAQYWDTAQDVAHALMALGVEAGDRVAIHSENRREWLFSDVAIVACRAMTMGLYPTNPAAEVRHLLSDSGAKVLIAEDQEQLDKALEVADDCPLLERIVFIEPRGILGRYDDDRLVYWNDFVAAGQRHRQAHPGEVERRMAEAGPDDTMTLIYTSGTTGPPKGVMLSVRNVEFAVEALVVGGGFTDPPPTQDDVILSYLPLSHVAERIFTVWFNAAVGVQVNFAESIETVQQNLAEVQPTILFGVPRIWEKVLAGINIRMNSASPVKRATYRFWMRVAERIGDVLVRTGGVHTVQTRLLYATGWLFLFRALRKRIGMSKVRYAASGAAPIAPDVLQFFMGLGVPMHEVYGMSENSAIATGNRPGRVKLGTVGEPHPDVEVRIDEATGEILTRHAGNFQGYWGLADETAAVLDPDGWLHTGDVGEWVDGTHIRITDRMKDIIITAGGKNIAPSEIENSLKASPYIKEAVVIGDGRKYLTALIGIELDTVGDWAQRRRLPYTTYRDLAEKDEVVDLITGIVRDTNQRFARVEGIKRFRMMPKELDHEDGELTATQKVKRSALYEMFSELVESMYAPSAPTDGRPRVGAGADDV